MRTDTNMAWPDDPYGTGQLWRKESLLLSGFSVCRMADDQLVWPVSYAVAYLRLHRTQTIDLTPGVSFGFRAVTIETTAELQDLLRVFDLDAMRARRLGKIVAGWRLSDELAVMQALNITGTETRRGIQGLAESWLNRGQNSRALAHICDVAYDCTDGDHRAMPVVDLITMAASNRINVSKFAQFYAPLDVLPAPLLLADTERLAVCSTAHALICALIAGRILSRFTWEGSLDIETALAANAGDCFMSLNS